MRVHLVEGAVLPGAMGEVYLREGGFTWWRRQSCLSDWEGLQVEGAGLPEPVGGVTRVMGWVYLV